MKILNVCVGLDMRQSGGYAERTVQMSKSMARVGVDCEVLTMDIDLEDSRIAELFPVPVIVLKTWNKRFNLPIGGVHSIFSAVKKADLVHLIGHWYFINVIAYFAIRYYKKPYVVCPAGALPLFGRSKLIKYLFNLIIGKNIVKNADYGIAVIEEEREHFYSYGLKNVIVIPNAVDKEEYTYPENISFVENYNIGNEPFILFMGRLNPIKGPDILLDAFIKLRSKLSTYQLVFAGSDEGLLEPLIKKSKEYNVRDKIHFVGHITGDEKLSAIYQSSILVVPSRMEAMSIVAIEAGICETAVIVTDQCGLSEINTISELMECTVSATDLYAKLNEILSEPEIVKRLGFEWNKLVTSKYVWNKVVRNYVDLYQQILNNKLIY